MYFCHGLEKGCLWTTAWVLEFGKNVADRIPVKLAHLAGVFLLHPPVGERLFDAAEYDLHEGVLQPLDVLAAHVRELHVLVHPGQTRKQHTEFPIPSCVRFRHVLFWEFPCPAWAVAS